ncbi:hypothetical protein KAU11_08340 [Candidatus Babeliales bacterium]|nr:hypothetical protein [Candidatus Babeliales bacterium]
MFDIKSAFGFDKDKANQGVDHVFGPDPKEDWVTICKIGNDNYNRVLKKAFRAAHEQLELLKTQGEAGEAAAAALDEKIHNEVLAETIVTNWGNGMSDGLTSIQSTLENRAAILAKYPDFKEACLNFAGMRTNYPMVESVEKVKK